MWTERKKTQRLILIHLLEIHVHVYYRQLMVNQILQSALIRFHIFSIIFDPEIVGTSGVAVLCCQGKVVLVILHLS